MGRLVLQGMGIAIGVAFWPIVLPVLVLMLIAAALHSATEQPKTQTRAEPTPAPSKPLLGALRREQLAIVEQRNREHLENSFRKS